jgi:hypothetical protein
MLNASYPTFKSLINAFHLFKRLKHPARARCSQARNRSTGFVFLFGMVYADSAMCLMIWHPHASYVETDEYADER